ncbi:hypothetical protein B0H13DRAFT_2016183 [Mycena leptocephala]|nr:hypothetical protein B0H13DRAFT_2016183 [Mycena leptocephala]
MSQRIWTPEPGTTSLHSGVQQSESAYIRDSKFVQRSGGAEPTKLNLFLSQTDEVEEAKEPKRKWRPPKITTILCSLIAELNFGRRTTEVNKSLYISPTRNADNNRAFVIVGIPGVVASEKSFPLPAVGVLIQKFQFRILFIVVLEVNERWGLGHYRRRARVRLVSVCAATLQKLVDSRFRLDVELQLGGRRGQVSFVLPDELRRKVRGTEAAELGFPFRRVLDRFGLPAGFRGTVRLDDLVD